MGAGVHLVGHGGLVRAPEGGCPSGGLATANCRLRRNSAPLGSFRSFLAHRNRVRVAQQLEIAIECFFGPFWAFGT